ncbi:MAG: hypothetical protein QNJ33_15805 [Crocosphaera sp.]|nr:hypothetical protein [Crocosphaera sp.]
MTKFIRFPFFCLVIVVLTYSVFGWYVGTSAITWSDWLANQGEAWGWFLEDEAIFVLLHLLAGGVVLLITASLAAPVAIITIVFGSSFQSDNKAIVAVLLWSFIIVLMLRWIAWFAQFFLLLSAAILAKLELQKLGYPQWQVMSMLIILCLGGFALGLLGYYQFH